MTSFSKPSTQQASDWTRIFRLIDPAIDSFAEEKGLRVTRWRWEFPNRVLIPREHVDQSIQVVIVGDQAPYQLEISWATRNKGEILRTLDVPDELKDSSEFLEVRLSLRSTLDTAYDTLKRY